MRVALVASEVAPFAKTGGLADVAGSLPKALQELGCDVKVFMPKYSTIDEAKYDLHYEYGVGEIPVRVAGVAWPVHIQRTVLPGSTVEVYFVDCPHFFHRGTIYTADPDEGLRFVLLCKAVIETLQRLQWAPDVVHCNDWQASLLPLLIKDNYQWDMLFRDTASLLSIHNIGYQGLFAASTMRDAELRSDLFHAGGPLEYNGAVCFLKAGILFSEILSTVSETYAREILTPAYGAGMEDILATRSRDLHGVLNGIDVDEWDPSTDRHIPHTYSADDLGGKLLNKKFLIQNTHLEFSARTPLIGIVSRLVAQKGFDLVAAAIDDLMEMDAQWVILGSGEGRFENMFRSIAQARPGRVWLYLGFNNELAHLIEAGADMFLMPSRYEPCGLNQMYSLRYGTVPIVRKTGGLADTIQDWHEFEAKGTRSGNGFSFEDATGRALATTLRRAVDVFTHDPDLWRTIQLNGMQCDFSWTRSAARYLKLYDMAVARRRA
jgi:starch synthase